MRTTLTLDEDVARKLQAERHRSGQSFKQTVNDCLRRGLLSRRELKPHQPFVVRARRLGLRPGLSYDSIGDLLEQLEGPAHR